MCPVTVFEQDDYDLRVEWGLDGVHALGPHCAVLVIIDVLVFTTSVDVALGRGARVLPLPWRDEQAAAAAGAAGAVLTTSGLARVGEAGVAADPGGWTLRPSSLVDVPADTFLAAGQVPELLAASVSGRELITAGVAQDVALASEVDASTVVPVLSAGVFAL